MVQQHRRERAARRLHGQCAQSVISTGSAPNVCGIRDDLEYSKRGTAFADYGDATYRQYAYIGRGELTAGIGYLSTNVTSQAVPLPGRRHECAYDSIANRQWSNSTGVSGLRDEGNSRGFCRPFRALCFGSPMNPWRAIPTGAAPNLCGDREDGNARGGHSLCRLWRRHKPPVCLQWARRIDGGHPLPWRECYEPGRVAGIAPAMGNFTRISERLLSASTIESRLFDAERELGQRRLVTYVPWA